MYEDKQNPERDEFPKRGNPARSESSKHDYQKDITKTSDRKILKRKDIQLT